MLVSYREAATSLRLFFFFQAEDGIRDLTVTGVQTCALPISLFRTSDEFITRICTRALIFFFMAIIGNLSTISCLRLAQTTVRFEFASKARSACQSTRTTACTWQCQPVTLCSTHRRFTNTTRIRRFWLLVITC